jgi:hypothetical protein
VWGLGLDEFEHVGVEALRLELGEPVRAALIDLVYEALDELRVLSAEAAMGTIWSSPPWMISVGLSIFFRSSVIADGHLPSFGIGQAANLC